MVYLGSYVSEGGDGLAWVDLSGRKHGGVGWVGGNWTGAPFLARDSGPRAVADHFAYVAAAWESEQHANREKTKPGEIRLTALTAKGDKPVIKYPFTPVTAIDPSAPGQVNWGEQLGGVAVRNGVAVLSLCRLEQTRVHRRCGWPGTGHGSAGQSRRIVFRPAGPALRFFRQTVASVTPCPTASGPPNSPRPKSLSPTGCKTPSK